MALRHTEAEEQPYTRRLCVAMVAACPFPSPRGTPIRAFRLAEALAERGVDVHVVTYHLGEPLGPVPFQVHRIPRVPTYRRSKPGPTYQKLLLVDLLLAAALRRVLSRHPVDLVHAHHYEGLLVALAARGRARTPIVYDAHTLLASELSYHDMAVPQRVKRALGPRLDRWLPRRADHVFAVTEAIRDQLARRGVPEDRISLIPSGTEWSRFTARVPHRQARPAPTLVFAGNLAPYQGIDLLLHAFRAVLHAQPDARLQILTESSFEPYESLANSLGIRARIELVPVEFDALPELLSQADVAVNPRVDCDGLPQKVLNYMAAGLPIVSFDGAAPCIRHLETGWLVPNGNVAHFADGVLRLLADDRLAARLGRAARRRVRQEFGWDQAAERALRVYERLARPRDPDRASTPPARPHLVS